MQWQIPVPRLILLLGIGVFLVVPVEAAAQLPQLLPTCIDSGNCYTCDFITLFANWAKLILIGISAIVMLMIAIGGFLWILSAGNPERVQKGRQIMVEAVIGTVFVFIGYFLVNLATAALLGVDLDQVKLYGTDWATYCESGRTPTTPLSDCTQAGSDGQVCQSGDCKENCLCLSSNCVSACTYEASRRSTATVTVSGLCLDESEKADCVATGGTVIEGGELCAEDEICCIE